jgi:hypothetical protein
MLGKIICWWKGKHVRGIPIAATEQPHAPGDQNVKRFRCPRCKRVTAYKVKVAS